MKKELTKKTELAEKLGMQFDEVAEVFSEETLSTMMMGHTLGGNDDTIINFDCPTYTYKKCQGSCNPSHPGCVSKFVFCDVNGSDPGGIKIAFCRTTTTTSAPTPTPA